MKKKILIGAFLVLVVAWFVISNVFMTKYTGTFNLSDGKEWTSISWEVKEGEADKFSAKLSDPKKIEVSYNGDYDLLVNMTLGNENGDSAVYELHAYSDWDPGLDTTTVISDFTKIQ